MQGLEDDKIDDALCLQVDGAHVGTHASYCRTRVFTSRTLERIGLVKAMI
jgi:hypothetical protein